MKARIKIQSDPFDLVRELEDMPKAAGALASFTGHVRGEDGVDALVLEHYPGMAEREIARHVEDAACRWPLLGVTVIHRVGELKAGERIVLVAVAAAHRSDAFAACEFLMDHLKHTATFWKQERRGTEMRWVDARASDDKAAKRWT